MGAQTASIKARALLLRELLRFCARRKQSAHRFCQPLHFLAGMVSIPSSMQAFGYRRRREALLRQREGMPLLRMFLFCTATHP